jgi:hypothetical protein
VSEWNSGDEPRTERIERGGLYPDDPAAGARDAAPLGRSAESPPLSGPTGTVPEPGPMAAPHAAPTTDTAGQITTKPQAKIIAVLGGGVGATIVAAVVSGLFGVDLDPQVATVLAGGIVTVVGTLVGYLRPNRTDAN